MWSSDPGAGIRGGGRHALTISHLEKVVLGLHIAKASRIDSSIYAGPRALRTAMAVVLEGQSEKEQDANGITFPV